MQRLNLPNAITLSRIASAPLIALLPFSSHHWTRLAAFILFIAAAVTDYFDGKLARERNLVTDLGRLLDPLADKLLLLATFVPMFILMAPAADPLVGMLGAIPGSSAFAFESPLGAIGLPWWVVAVVLGRELFMTIFRQYAVRRGVVISAIGPAKWKTGFQSTWVGASYFWFFALTLARAEGWNSAAWNAFALFNGFVGYFTMVVAVALTLYSLALYIYRYSSLLRK